MVIAAKYKPPVEVTSSSGATMPFKMTRDSARAGPDDEAAAAYDFTH